MTDMGKQGGLFSGLRGLMAERRAAAYLRGLGMTVERSRYRAADGEIDLIMRDGETLVFVEVKSAPHLGEGAMRVDKRKRLRIKSAARAYLKEHPADAVRYDVLEESDAGLRLMKNAF